MGGKSIRFGGGGGRRGRKRSEREFLRGEGAKNVEGGSQQKKG